MTAALEGGGPGHAADRQMHCPSNRPTEDGTRIERYGRQTHQKLVKYDA